MCSVTLKFSDSESFIGISPFLIAREIRTLVGEVLSAKPLATGELRIKTATQDQSERLLRTVRFLKKNITCQPSDRLRTTDAFAFAPSLVGVPQDELLAELSSQGVVGAYRLRPRNGKPNPGIRLTFSGASFPASIRAGFEDINLRPWLRNPLLCRHCSKYGHTAKHCRTQGARCLRCSQDHSTDDCESTDKRCPHCGGGHAAWERSCPVLQDHFKKEADKILKQPRPEEPKATTTSTASQTVPEATKQATKNVSNQAKICQMDMTTQTRPSTLEDASIQTEVDALQEDNDDDTGQESANTGDHQTAQPPLQTRLQRLQPPTNPELSDPELFPTPRLQACPEDQHPYVFLYADGSQPPHPTTRLFRYEQSVRVVDLDLRPRTKANRAATNGFFFDGSYGRILYLKK